MKKKGVVVKKRDWTKVRDLIMRWSQDDGTSDELMDVVSSMGYDPLDPDAFWIEFEKRLSRAFGSAS